MAERSGGKAPHITELGTSWDWSASRPGRLIPRNMPHSAHWMRGWVGLIRTLSGTEKYLIPATNRTPIPLSYSDCALQVVRLMTTGHSAVIL